MRTREEIIGDATEWLRDGNTFIKSGISREQLILEVLLDIRDLLRNTRF